MRRWLFLLGVLTILLSGCSVGVEVTREDGPNAGPDHALPGPLEVSDCISQKDGSWQKVSCTAPDATAQVTKVTAAEGNQRFTLRPDCPPRTDLALSQPAASTLSYVCARNLKPPHPGDPGQGGGTVDAGDCVNTAGSAIDEVPCDGSGAKPQYRIREITRKPCPKDGKGVSFSLGSPDLSGVPEGGYACADRL